MEMEKNFTFRTGFSTRKGQHGGSISADLMALYLMYEYAQGSASMWHPYLSLLPLLDELTLPTLWDKSTLQLLQGSMVSSFALHR